MSPFGVSSVVGCIVGGAIGDVLGGVAERGSPSISDDTQLTLATCEAIIQRRAPTPEGIAAQMAMWFREGRISGIGSSTLKAMRDLAGGAHWALAGARGERAAGNGAAMRIAPAAFFFDPQHPRERTMIRDISRITHHHDEAYIGALAVVFAIRSAASRRLMSAEELAMQLPDSRVRDSLETSGRHPEWGVRNVVEEIGSSGFTPETIACAVVVARAITEVGVENAINELNEVGGDTDTIGSIAGQIAGAWIGAEGLPIHFLQSVRGAEEVFETAERFAACVTAA